MNGCSETSANPWPWSKLVYSSTADEFQGQSFLSGVTKFLASRPGLKTIALLNVLLNLRYLSNRYKLNA
jgi:hypothetical protein